MMPTRPTVFIGSSTKSLPVARAVAREIDETCDATVWDQDIFEPSTYALDELVRLAHTFDYAVLIASADDQRISGPTTIPVPRDNVIAEAGLFIGAMGRQRVFLIEEDNPEIHLPTDFLGLTTLRYRARDVRNHRAEVSAACETLRHVISQRSSSREERHSLWPLAVAIVSNDDVAVARLVRELERYKQILLVRLYTDLDAARNSAITGEIGGMIVDLSGFGGSSAVDLITHLRDRQREIGFALFGTRDELFSLPRVTGIWRQTLQHYWQIPKDMSPESFAVRVEDVVLMLFLYRLSDGRFGDHPGRLALAIMRPEVAGTWDVWSHL